MPKYGGRRYGYGRPGRRVRGYYRARSRQPGPISGCLLPLVIGSPSTSLERMAIADQVEGDTAERMAITDQIK